MTCAVKSIVLLSGGLDSATVLAMRAPCHAVGFDYGQAHRIELTRARILAERYRSSFEVVDVPRMPKVNNVVFAGRNLVLAAMAVSIAQARGFNEIAVGCNKSDWKRFPDCRPGFWSALSKCAEGYGVRVFCPLLYKTKKQVLKVAEKLLVPVELTWSCYAPKRGRPCNRCLACQVRAEAFV